MEDTIVMTRKSISINFETEDNMVEITIDHKDLEFERMGNDYFHNITSNVLDYMKKIVVFVTRKNGVVDYNYEGNPLWVLDDTEKMIDDLYDDYIPVVERIDDKKYKLTFRAPILTFRAKMKKEVTLNGKILEKTNDYVYFDIDSCIEKEKEIFTRDFKSWSENDYGENCIVEISFGEVEESKDGFE